MPNRQFVVRKGSPSGPKWSENSPTRQLGGLPTTCPLPLFSQLTDFLRKQKNMEKEKVPLTDARKAAAAILRQLRKFCVKCKVAGSIRRKKSMVSDIEVLFIPQTDQVADPNDLFGHNIPVDYLVEALKVLQALGILERRKTKKGRVTYGKWIKLMRHVKTGIAVDFFACTPETWWTSLVSRTGGKASNEILSGKAKARGFKWRPNGGGFSTRSSKTIVFPVNSEAAAFRFVKMEYRRPELRP